METRKTWKAVKKKVRESLWLSPFIKPRPPQTKYPSLWNSLKEKIETVKEIKDHKGSKET